MVGSMARLSRAAPPVGSGDRTGFASSLSSLRQPVCRAWWSTGLLSEQHLDHPDVATVLQHMGGEAVSQGVRADLLGQSRRFGRGPAGGMLHLHINRFVATAKKQQVIRMHQAPVSPQDTEKLRREHDGSVLGTFAMTDLDQHAIAVDIRDFQTDYLGGTQAPSIGRCQCRACLQRRHHLKKTRDIVGTRDHLQFAWRAQIGNPFAESCTVQRHAIEEAQGKNRLFQS